MESKKCLLIACLLSVSLLTFSQKLYIAENGSNAIQRSEADGTDLELISGAGDVGAIKDIVVDEVRNRVFWVENNGSNALVKRADMVPTAGTIQLGNIVNFIQVAPGNLFEGLAINKTARELYVTSTGTGGSIYRVSLDANPITVLPAPTLTSLFQTFGIDIDDLNNKMYFVNQSTTRQIQMANADGTSPSVILNVSGTLGTIHDVAVDPVGGSIYFSTNLAGIGQIYKAGLDGSNPLMIVDSQPSTVKGIALDTKKGFVYWATGATSVGRANLDGTGATNIVTALSTPDYIALDFSTTALPKLYWTEGNIQEIHRINPDGSDFERYYFGSSPYPTGIAIDFNARYVYWADRNQSTIKRGLIGETDFESSEVVLDYTDMFPGISGIDLDPGNTMIYFVDAGNNRIQRADYSQVFPITGSDVELVNNPFGLDLDLANGKVYYTANDLAAPNTGTLYRANLDGSGAPEVLITQPSPGAAPERFMHDVKVDPISGTVYWAFTESDGPATVYKADISNVSGTVTPLIPATSGEVRGIEIDPQTNKIWWVCRGNSGASVPPGIMQADLDDGSNVTPLHEITFLPPNANFIALDAPPPLRLTSISPASNTNHVAVSSNITLTFDQNVDGTTVNSSNILITGNQTGQIQGSFSGGGTPSITFDPLSDFKPGEIITVTITDGVLGSSSEVAEPFLFQFTAASGIGPGTFSGENILTTNADGANALYAIDLDSDGDMDIVSGSRNDNKVAWYENDGSQNFAERIISTAANSVRSVYAADVDGDGDVDVLSASIIDQKVAWYENDGSENFTERIIDTNPAGPVAILATDMDRDGDMDVVITANQDEVAWYENDGSQTFTKFIIDNTLDSPQALSASDLDSDGDMDIITVSWLDNTVAWHENNGGQSFTKRVISPAAQNPLSVFAIDIDDDGDLDVLSSAFDFSRIYLWNNDGSQVFSQNTVTTSLLNAIFVSAADMDGDGDIDVLGASQTDNEVVFYDNDGSEVFTENIVSAVALAVQAVIAADMDNDGDLDIISASAADDKIAWYENSIPVSPLALVNTNPVQNTNGVPVNTIIDLNFDQNVNATTVNNTNIIITGEQTGIITGAFSGGGTPTIQFDPTTDFKPGEVIRVVLTRGLLSADGGNLAESQSYQFTTASAPAPETPPFFAEKILTTTADDSFALFPADVDGDGDMDIVGTAAGTNSVLYFENDGNQVFTENIVSSTANGPTGVYVADMDSDGDMDILVASQSGGSILWFENDGSENFTEQIVTSNAGAPGKVYASDLDGDGDMDVVSTSFAPSVGSIANARLNYYINDGSENFAQFNISTVNGTSAYPIDVDGDGDVDLVATSEAAALTALYANELSWFENDGSLNFTEHIIDNISRIQIDSYATDMDGDGDVDILMVGSLSFVGWFENDGSQNFTEHEIGSSESQPRAIHAVDVDGDGDMDVITAHELLDEVVLWLNDGSQNFTRQSVTTDANLVWDIYAADVDSDGDIDLMSASRFGDKIAWYENTIAPCASIPTSNAGPDQTICPGNVATLAGTIGGGAIASAWSTGGTGMFDDSSVLTPEYTPSALDESNGSVTLTLTVPAMGSCPLVSDDMTLTIAMPVSAAPLAVNAGVQVTVNTDVISLATINPGDVITVTIQQNGTQGTATVLGDNSIDYTANAGSSGTDVVDYQICNQCGSCDTQSITYTIFNQPPIFNPASISFATGAMAIVDILDQFVDPDNDIDPATLAILTAPTSGASATINASNQLVIDYTAGSYAGDDDIEIEVCDSGGNCLQQIITIQVTNTAPSLSVPQQTLAFNGQLTLDLATFIIDPENNLDLASFSVVQSPGSGAAVSFSGTTLSADYSTTNFAGTDSFVIEVCDLTGACVQSTVAILISNEAPTIAVPVQSAIIKSIVSVDLLSLISDPDGNLDPATFAIISPPISNAPAFIVNSTLTVDYSDSDFVGTDMLTIQACDLAGACTQQVITIEVDGSITVNTGISPNGDGKNDTWMITNINSLEPVNRVFIYTRWGDKIYEAENYDNATVVFDGLNSNGNEVASGVYFYKIEFGSGRPSASGYLTIKR